MGERPVSQPYSYRSDGAVPEFPDDRPVLFFDGLCVLCTGFARFVIERDGNGLFRFASAQSALGQALYRHYGLDPVDFDTNLLIADGRPFTKSDAFIALMALLGGRYALASALRIVPRPLRDLAYDPIARNRYRLFGERASCYVPTAQERTRFLA